MELSFKEDKSNGKSQCEAFLKFTSHDAAAEVKSFIEKSSSFKVVFANIASKTNPFRETAKDSKQTSRESQYRTENVQQDSDHSYNARNYQRSRDNRSRNYPYGRDSRPYNDGNRRRSRDRRERDNREY